MNLNQWRDEIHALAKEKGWWEGERTFGEIIALCHSELSKALEEYRAGNYSIYYSCTENPAIIKPCIYEDGNQCKLAFMYYGECNYKNSKPEGMPAKLADCIIRILDYCGKEGIDIEEAVKIKHQYNKTPCRVGDTVYAIIDSVDMSYVRQEKVIAIEFLNKNGAITLFIRTPYGLFEFGKTVFLTKEAAEKALVEGESC